MGECARLLNRQYGCVCVGCGVGWVVVVVGGGGGGLGVAGGRSRRAYPLGVLCDLSFFDLKSFYH